MTVWRLFSATSRRAVTIGVAMALCAVSASGLQAQQTAAQQPAAQQTPAQPPDPLKLDLDVPTLLIFQVKPDRAADFEVLWQGIRAGLSKSAKPEVKAFAETLQPYRVQLPADPPPTLAIFVFRLDPPSKTFSYHPVKLLYDMDPDAIKREEAKPLFDKWDGALMGFSIWPLKKVGG